MRDGITLITQLFCCGVHFGPAELADIDPLNNGPVTIDTATGK
jgi:hypothetical protein